MGLISFIKNAGAKIFKSEEKREEEKANLITQHIKKFGFDVSKVKVAVDDEKVILTGSVDTHQNKNKIIVTAGNVEGISVVEDHLLVITPEPVAPPEPEKQFYTVKKGDYLSKIAKEVYGDASLNIFLCDPESCIKTVENQRGVAFRWLDHLDYNAGTFRSCPTNFRSLCARHTPIRERVGRSLRLPVYDRCSSSTPLSPACLLSYSRSTV